ncbi:MAG: hypothetical protein ABIY58_14270, partial [Acidimicrobiales bacterium]
MNPLESFLVLARRRIVRHRGLVWTVHAALLAATGEVVAQLLARRWPVDPEWPPLLGAVVIGICAALVGWRRGRPSLIQTARVADRNLGGCERLTTAWELAGAGGPLVLRQRADAETWVATEDPRRVIPGRLPRREMAAAAM